MKTKLTLAALLMSVLFYGSSASATTIRTISKYGQLGDNSASAPVITGTGASLFDATVYQCHDGSPCNIDLNLPSTDPCSFALNLSGSGAEPCFDLMLTIPTNAVIAPGTQVTVSIPGFTDTSDQFGLFLCASSTPGGNQGFDGICAPTSLSIPSDCTSATLTTPLSNTLTLPSACLIPGMAFYFDESANNSVDIEIQTATTTPEPGSLALMLAGLFPLAIFSRKRLRADVERGN